MGCVCEHGMDDWDEIDILRHSVEVWKQIATEQCAIAHLESRIGYDVPWASEHVEKIFIQRMQNEQESS